MQNYNQSILSLFDPLRTPATPERDAASPDLSDKENDAVGHCWPDREEDDMDEDEEEGGMVLDGLEADAENGEYRRTVADDDMDENADEDTIQIPVSRRQPLADIQLDSVLGSIPEPDPIPVEGSPDSSMWDAADTTIQAVSAAPAGAPLASIINAINFASLSLHSPDSSHEPSTPDGQSGFDCPAAPEINVVEADSSHGSPTAPTPRRLFGSHLSPSPSSSSFATRRLSPTTSATDPRRTSVDLQSSFHLQLQNAEMTFDLMNDKISFLGHDSFWVGNDEDSVDLKKEEQAMMAIAEEYEPQYSANGQIGMHDLIAAFYIPSSSGPADSQEILEDTRPSKLGLIDIVFVIILGTL
ncbi:hypothetical protein EUX98_g7524 [Antrodiella citrinella]|uniref:Uncharacterized protein n=1 Tax=Antrodiella citrinella TaxID=2447956 RepID=A0A4S4MTK0_9APHY|nr:hypothetical protein EUX98_g7524 [Antrodiella citrinella]